MKRRFNWDLWWNNHTRSHVPKAVRLVIFTVDDVFLRLKFLAGNEEMAEHVSNTWVNAIFVRGMSW